MCSPNSQPSAQEYEASAVARAKRSFEQMDDEAGRPEASKKRRLGFSVSFLVVLVEK